MMLWFAYTLENFQNPFKEFLFVSPYQSQEQIDIVLEEALKVFKPFEAENREEALEKASKGQYDHIR